MKKYKSWGGRLGAQKSVHQICWLEDLSKLDAKASSVLPFGLGRSYGDSCLNDEGHLLDTHACNRFLNLDVKKKRLRAESGVTFDEILQLIVKKGLFLPIVPGTKYLTLGGAIANDIHGKNHHKRGCFGNYVRQFELLRSDGKRYVCSKEENSDLFCATIGGLGLTGTILWAEIELISIEGPFIDVESIQFKGLDEFTDLSKESHGPYEYTVAWVDCLSTGDNFCRGIFMRGNHARKKGASTEYSQKGVSLGIPFAAPKYLLNPLTVKMFNHLYYHKQKKKRVKTSMSYESFFFPLDHIHRWNLLYGQKGFYQYQCVIPKEAGSIPLTTLMELIIKSGLASFLAVLKVFGDIPSPGMLSFPKAGMTLALDFPNYGDKVLDLFEALDKIVRDCHGRVYPAKDARMTAKSFQAFFPQVKEFQKFKDAGYDSNFWRRVTASD